MHLHPVLIFLKEERKISILKSTNFSLFSICAFFYKEHRSLEWLKMLLATTAEEFEVG